MQRNVLSRYIAWCNDPSWRRLHTNCMARVTSEPGYFWDRSSLCSDEYIYTQYEFKLPFFETRTFCVIWFRANSTKYRQSTRATPYFVTARGGGQRRVHKFTRAMLHHDFKQTVCNMRTRNPSAGALHRPISRGRIFQTQGIAKSPRSWQAPARRHIWKDQIWFPPLAKHIKEK